MVFGVFTSGKEEDPSGSAPPSASASASAEAPPEYSVRSTASLVSSREVWYLRAVVEPEPAARRRWNLEEARS